MTHQSTIDKLIEMRLTTMADAFRNQLDDPKFKEVPFEDRFGMLVDIEYKGLVPQYYVKDDHEPIIPKELFYRVQEELARRAAMNKSAVTRKKNKRANFPQNTH